MGILTIDVLILHHLKAFTITIRGAGSHESNYKDGYISPYDIILHLPNKDQSLGTPEDQG